MRFNRITVLAALTALLAAQTPTGPLSRDLAGFDRLKAADLRISVGSDRSLTFTFHGMSKDDLAKLLVRALGDQDAAKGLAPSLQKSPELTITLTTQRKPN